MNQTRNEKQTAQKFINSLDKLISWWHQFPIDYWWRKKYNIPFGSSKHREMNIIDMYFEYQEDAMIRRYHENLKKKEEEAENEHLNIGNEKNKNKIVHMTNKEIEDDYDNLDLSQFDEK